MFWKISCLVSALCWLAAAAGAQVQTDAQQKCLVGLNAGGAKVAAAQAKANLSCLKAANKGAEPAGGSAQSCLTADAGGKVAKAVAKVGAVETKKCATPPDFGAQSASQVVVPAQQSVTALFDDLFGGDLDAAAASCDANKPGCVCQQAVVKSVYGIVDAATKQFVRCNKEMLDTDDTGASLSWCIDDVSLPASVAADGKGKITKKVEKFANAIADKCSATGQSFDTLFPGKCVGASDEMEFGGCAIERVKCRVCRMLRTIDGLHTDCDYFDDFQDNGSCVEGFTLRSGSSNQLVTLDIGTGGLSATAAEVMSANEFFSFETISSTTYIRSTGNGMYWSAGSAGSQVHADAIDVASATAWVIFVDSGSGALLILKDGSASPTVDAIRRDPSSGALVLTTAAITTVLDDSTYHFTMQ
ncbi:MAG TPA: hypothetical protein VEB21_07170 [Terriglobales bacterium]|nr:hypothetical protein [Terriglobales bacterium]